MKLHLQEESTQELPMYTKTCEQCLKCLQMQRNQVFTKIDAFVYLLLKISTVSYSSYTTEGMYDKIRDYVKS